MTKNILISTLLTLAIEGNASIPANSNSFQMPKAQMRANAETQLSPIQLKSTSNSTPLIFDVPVTYNKSVSRWIKYYQSSGRTMFKRWLEKSAKYFPLIQSELSQANLPKDLAYLVMIESGFTANAHSFADAVGPWQFIESTAHRYGMRTTWWLDERRDLRKSTQSAIRYMKDLYVEFESWYLVAASYNMGENGLNRVIQKYKTKDYWQLIHLNAIPLETQEYVPKFLAAMLIAKAPSLYGFRDLNVLDPVRYQLITVPGGTKLDAIADYLGITRQSLKDLNAELKFAMIPKEVPNHTIRIPVGSYTLTKRFIMEQNDNVAMESLPTYEQQPESKD